MKKRVEEKYKMDKSCCSCIDCDIIFASIMNLHKLFKTGCPENDEPTVKRLCDKNTDESDESGWDNIVRTVYNGEKVKSYEIEGYSNLESRQKATEDLFWKYRKSIMRCYADILTKVNCLKWSLIQQEVMDEIKTLMNKKILQICSGFENSSSTKRIFV